MQGQVDGVSFQEKDGYTVRLMRMIPTSKVLAENIRVNEAAPIREGAEECVCLVFTH